MDTENTGLTKWKAKVLICHLQTVQHRSNLLEKSCYHLKKMYLCAWNKNKVQWKTK
jgi:hypothetical protein